MLTVIFLADNAAMALDAAPTIRGML